MIGLLGPLKIQQPWDRTVHSKMNCARKEPLTLEFWTLSTVWAGFRDASGSVSKAYLFVIEEFLEGDARIRGYASEALDSEASVNGTQHCFHEMSLAMHTIWPKVSRTAEEEYLFSVTSLDCQGPPIP